MFSLHEGKDFVLGDQRRIAVWWGVPQRSRMTMSSPSWKNKCMGWGGGWTEEMLQLLKAMAKSTKLSNKKKNPSRDCWKTITHLTYLYRPQAMTEACSRHLVNTGWSPCFYYSIDICLVWANYVTLIFKGIWFINQLNHIRSILKILSSFTFRDISTLFMIDQSNNLTASVAPGILQQRCHN